MKTCKDCRQTLPLDQFTKVGARPGGRGTRCHGCFNILRRVQRAERAAAEGRAIKPRVKFDPASGVRRCPTCETERPLDAFSKGQRECRGCRSARFARSRQEHPERERERHRRYDERHPGARLAAIKRWQATARGKESLRRAARRYWNSRSPDQQRAMLLRWYESRYSNTALRRARIYATRTEPIRRAEIIARDQRTCYLCGRADLTDREIHLDHVVPLSRGGTHTYDNVRVACVVCNYRKSNRLPA